MRKREKPPPLPGTITKSEQRSKTSTPQQDREGLVPPFQALFKEKTSVLALHALHQ